MGNSRIATNDEFVLFETRDGQGYIYDSINRTRSREQSIVSILAKGVWTPIKQKAFFGHAGRPGQVGGSVPRTGAGSVSKTEPLAERRPGLAGKKVGKVTILERDAIAKKLEKKAYEFIKDSNAYGETVKGLKNDVVLELSQRAGLDYVAVNNIIGNWARTANDTDPYALNLQADFAEELGLDLSDWQKQKLDELSGNPFKDDRHATRSDQKRLARAMYDLTQERLREMGYKDGDYITLYRGMTSATEYKKDSIIDYHGNAMESWSIASYTAVSFATHPQPGEWGSMVFKMQVPIENIVGTYFSGWGCKGEDEMIVMGNLPGQQALVIYAEAK